VSLLTPALAAHVPALARRLEIDCRVDRPVVAQTLDHGPHDHRTPAVHPVVAASRARATFFLVGEQVERRPGVARAIVEAGHEIGLHGHRHTLLLRRRVRELAADLDRATAAIAEATGVEPKLYRPPYGVFTSGALEHVRARGLRPLLWSAWGRDWERTATPARIARRVTRSLAPGDVVLLHDSDAYSSADSWRRTAAALPAVCDAGAAIGVEADAVTQST
jgi:peptidoglycan/xylan/chitin deacetylase (PgdA/CDA1 family)